MIRLTSMFYSPFIIAQLYKEKQRYIVLWKK